MPDPTHLAPTPTVSVYAEPAIGGVIVRLRWTFALGDIIDVRQAFAFDEIRWAYGPIDSMVRDRLTDAVTRDAGHEVPRPPGLESSLDRVDWLAIGGRVLAEYSEWSPYVRRSHA